MREMTNRKAPRMARSSVPAARRRRSPAENDGMVFTVLSKSDRPLTAYELLGRLRTKGITAPPTVYRSLERLIKDGLAHRLETLNAFVACAKPHHRSAAIFAICRKCGTTAEFSDPKPIGPSAFASTRKNRSWKSVASA